MVRIALCIAFLSPAIRAEALLHIGPGRYVWNAWSILYRHNGFESYTQFRDKVSALNGLHVGDKAYRHLPKGTVLKLPDMAEKPHVGSALKTPPAAAQEKNPRPQSDAGVKSQETINRLKAELSAAEKGSWLSDILIGCAIVALVIGIIALLVILRRRKNKYASEIEELKTAHAKEIGDMRLRAQAREEGFAKARAEISFYQENVYKDGWHRLHVPEEMRTGISSEEDERKPILLPYDPAFGNKKSHVRIFGIPDPIPSEDSAIIGRLKKGDKESGVACMHYDLVIPSISETASP
jgi:uncharacterized membrane-anchored protein YhcB (DUF1043 family)